ncbi:MAG TPA: cytidine deaminase [Clostridiales bacterium]|nr:cytidine deaminase [Clostridiales bacterium]
MFQKLKDGLKNSYSPYSNYPVSAVVITKDGKEYTGVNIENASYGATICAERSSIFKAVSEGYRKGDLKELHLMVGSGRIGMPCFLCRQVISEFFEEDDTIVCYSTKGDKRSFKVRELCPEPFGPEDL